MRRYIFVLVVSLIAFYNTAYAGFLTGVYSNVALFKSTILSGTCAIRNVDNETLGSGEVTLALEDEKTELVCVLQGKDTPIDITIRMPLKYLRVNILERTLDDGTPYTVYDVVYGNSRVAFINNEGMSLLVLKHNGVILDLTVTFEFYDYYWELIKKKDGGTLRTGYEVESWFSGLLCVKKSGI